MKKVIVAFALVIGAVNSNAVMAQHGGNQTTSAQKTEVTTHPASETFRKQLTALFTANTALKEAFVASDAARVQAQANATRNALSNVDMKQVQGAAHTDWMNYQAELDKHITAIARSTSLEEQRKHYQPFSQALYKSIKAFGLEGQEAYYQYCPMAFNNQGGYWLSDSKEVRNPYFGSQMLKCGSTKEVIQ
jgi:hypothetical protein